MRPDVTRWLERRTSTTADWPVDELLAAKHDSGSLVSVVLPALDEEMTVGDIVAAVRRTYVDVPDPLVDELVVMDSGSTDRTAKVAAAAGATVVARDEVLPRLVPHDGKGEVLWRSLAATSGDVLVFIDSDLTEFDPTYVQGLLGPLLTDRSVMLVKGFYDRPLRVNDGDGAVVAGQGGRVTELVARPLINLHWPELAGVVQPLAGEYAARRSLLETLPFPTGYGVELGLLVDTLAQEGLDALAQVDLGVRHHRHQSDAALGRMSSEILQTALARLKRSGRVRVRGTTNPTLAQFSRDEAGALVPSTHLVQLVERPAMLTIPEYAAARDAAAS